MGRELRRKQAKKEGKSLEKKEIIETHQIKKLIITVCILIVILVIIYLISALFITKELDWFNKKETDITTNNDSSTILASSIFKQVEETYYVYFYDFNEDSNVITSTVNSKLSSEKVYKVDTSSALNTKYISDESNKSAKKLEDLKVTPQTLIKISGEEIIEYYEKDEIIAELD